MNKVNNGQDEPEKSPEPDRIAIDILIFLDDFGMDTIIEGRN